MQSIMFAIIVLSKLKYLGFKPHSAFNKGKPAFFLFEFHGNQTRSDPVS